MRKALLLAAAVGLFIGGWAVVRAQSPGVNSPFVPVWTIPLDSIKRTYGLQATNLSPAAIPSDLVQLCGNATNTTKLTRVIVSGRATAQQALDIIVAKRSSLDLGGFFASNTPFGGTQIAGVSTVGQAFDTNDTASLSTVTAYSSVTGSSSATVNTANNFTFGTVVANIAAVQYFVANLTTGPSGEARYFDFGGPRSAKSPTLRTATQCIGVAVSPAGLAGNIFDATLEWTEE